jgi:NDP-sugar pyrophosphorylase family protein
MKAVILAGGMGTRLRPVVGDRPKALAEINGEPFLLLELRQLRRAGLGQVVLCLGHGAPDILAMLSAAGDLGLTVEHAIEPRPLGTAGALKHAGAYLHGEEMFLLLNGDTFVEIDHADLAAGHRRSASLVTLSVWESTDASGQGTVRLDDRGQVVSLLEKHGGGPALVNAGVYAMSRAVLERIPEGREVSLERATLPALLAAGEPIGSYHVRGTLIDIGTPADYQRAQEALRRFA